MQIKSGAVRIAQLYMQRVASELDLLSSISEKEPLLQFLLLQGVQFAFRVHQVSNFSSLISAVSDIEVSSFVFPHLWVDGYGSFEPNQPSPVFVVRNFRSKTVIGNCLSTLQQAGIKVVCHSCGCELDWFLSFTACSKWLSICILVSCLDAVCWRLWWWQYGSFWCTTQSSTSWQ